jgi:hypothetical protein
MSAFPHSQLLASTILLAGSTLPSFGVILAGPNGTGSGNSTQASLNTYITANSLPSFPYWNNVITVSDASGIYLGDGWVMTAAHVTPLAVNSSTITVNGTAYTVRGNFPVGAQDIRLYKIGGDPLDPPLPALPTVPLASTSVALNQSFLTFGAGSRQEGTANSATNSDAALAGSPAAFEWAGQGILRWGSNQVSNFPAWTGASGLLANSGGNLLFSSIMDDPGSGNYLNVTEAGHAVGDSGGPLFTLNGGAWQLHGISTVVGSDPASGYPASTTGFGTLTGHLHLPTYLAAINAIIPEPSAAALLCCSILGLAKRRRRIGA